MYYEIVIKWAQKCKKVTLPPLKNKETLARILNKLFHLKDEQIIGFTSNNSKFYDMESFASNLQAFDKQTIDLVTSTVVSQNQEAFPQIEDQNEFNIEPISFGNSFTYTASNTPNEFQNDYNPLNNDSQFYEHAQLPEEPESQIIAEIHDLKMFEAMFLDDDITIVVESSKRLDHLSFPHYHFKGKDKKIYIYQNHKKVCELPILGDNWNETEKIVLNVLKSFENFYNKPESAQKQENEANFFSTEPDIDLIYQKRKPLQSQQKQQPSQKHSKRESKQQKTTGFEKKKNQEENRFELFQKKQTLSERFEQPQRYEIPIIIRKSNNQIQKVTASYPLTHEQMQAINSLLQLEIQGLFTDEEINKVKMMVLGQNDAVLKIFDAYSKQKINIGELSKSLAGIVRRNEHMRR